jgi:1,4-alpha-glucan branching enzyme
VLAARLTGRTAAHIVPSGARTMTQFVLIAPGAASVTVVGDFNDWSMSATPLERAGGVWSVAVPLGPGTLPLRLRRERRDLAARPGGARDG